MAFPSRRKAVFVNGCFWHLHPGCVRARIPGTNREYWEAKLTRNRQRDLENIDALRALGWDAMTVWECELRDMREALARVEAFLGPPGS